MVVWLHRRTIRYRDFIFCKPCRIIYVKGWFPAKFVKYSKTLEAAKSVRSTLQCSKPSSILYSEISSTLPLSSPSVAPADLAAKAEKRTACLKEIDETEKVFADVVFEPILIYLLQTYIRQLKMMITGYVKNMRPLVGNLFDAEVGFLWYLLVDLFMYLILHPSIRCA